MTETLTQEEIARQYSSALDSVNLLNGGQPADMEDDEWADCLSRNQEHLRLMLNQNYWTTEDLQPLRDAAGDG